MIDVERLRALALAAVASRLHPATNYGSAQRELAATLDPDTVLELADAYLRACAAVVAIGNQARVCDLEDASECIRFVAMLSRRFKEPT